MAEPPGRQRERKNIAKAKTAEWRTNNPDRLEASYLRQRAKHFGITYDELVALYKRAANRCDICGGPPTKGRKRLSVDHCHATGRVRGLLCQDCNLALGYLEAHMVAACRYLGVVGHEEPTNG